MPQNIPIFCSKWGIQMTKYVGLLLPILPIPRRGGPMCPPSRGNFHPHPTQANSHHLETHPIVTHAKQIRTAHHGRTHGSAPNANRLRAKHSKGKKGTPKIVNVHNLCLPKLCHITMANVFLVFSFLLFCPALVQNVPVVLEPDAQTMFSESCLGAIDARMGCPRQSQQLNGLSTLPI